MTRIIRCTWPHEDMSDEDIQALTAAITRYRPFIEKKALRLAKRDKMLADDLVQRAFIMLWRWGPDRINASDEQLVRTSVHRRMKSGLRDELRAEGGPRRIRAHLRAA